MTESKAIDHATLDTWQIRCGATLGDIDPNHPCPEAVYWRAVDAHTQIAVYRMGGGQWYVCFGPRNLGVIDETYAYRDLDIALRAAAEWSGVGDPIDGWHRSPTNGRRRPDGDPTREELRW